MSNLAERVIDVYGSQPVAAILMSGQGSNAEAILSNYRLKNLYDIRAISTDSEQSNAKKIADSHNLKTILRPTERFLTLSERKAYFKGLAAELRDLDVQALFYAGFMRIVTADFCEEFPGVNVHPADLTVLGPDGLPKYRGMQALPTMRREMGFVRSTVHVVDNKVDAGTPLALTESLRPLPDETDADLHMRLKKLENKKFTETLVKLGNGALSLVDIPLRMES